MNRKLLIVPLVLFACTSGSYSSDNSPQQSAAKEEKLSSIRRQIKENLIEIDHLQKVISHQIDRDARATHLGPSTDLPGVCQGRLTLTSLTPVTTTNVTGATTIYFTPFLGSVISFYSGSVWTAYSFNEVSLALSGLTANKNYDVFVYNNAGVITLELSAAWANDTTRTDALLLQDGVYVKATATNRKYVGTFRATGATTTEDSATQRFVWNYFNRQVRYMFVTEAANSWTYASATWRAANNNAANQVRFVIGINDALVFGRVQNGAGTTSAGTPAANGVGVDSTTVNSATIYGEQIGVTANYSYTALSSDYVGYPGIGYHFLQWLESSSATGTTTFLNTNGNAFQGAGMFGEIEG